MADTGEHVFVRVETYLFVTKPILIDEAAFSGDLIGVRREKAF
jgi:hypothetical protein